MLNDVCESSDKFDDGNSIYDPTSGSGGLFLDIVKYNIQRTKPISLKDELRLALTGSSKFELPISFLKNVVVWESDTSNSFLLKIPKKTVRECVDRSGQQSFKNNLVKLYGESCAVTGNCPFEALDAAHIISYRESYNQSVENGLLLRADIHRLFDAGLLMINPMTFKVELHKKLLNTQYGSLHGLSINRYSNLIPRREFLKKKWLQTIEK